MELRYDNLYLKAEPRYRYSPNTQTTSFDLAWIMVCGIMGSKSKIYFNQNGLKCKEECFSPTAKRDNDVLFRVIEWEYDDSGLVSKKTIMDSGLATESDFKTKVVIDFLGKDKAYVVVEDLVEGKIVIEKEHKFERKVGQFDKTIHSYYDGLEESFFYLLRGIKGNKEECTVT